MARRLERLPSSVPGRTSTLLWVVTIAALAAGLGCWAYSLAADSLRAGVGALWLFSLAAVTLALVLPLPLALVSPLFMGLAGWLIDMLPLVILVGWTAVAARWALDAARNKRWPRGGRWAWLPVVLAAWTIFGGYYAWKIGGFKHFLLLLAMQFLASATLLAIVDRASSTEDRARVARSLLTFVLVCTVGVILQWSGVPVEGLQNEEVSPRLEEAYGVDAFVNSTGMVKYEWAAEGGAKQLRRRLDALRRDVPDIPPAEVYRPPFKAFDTFLVVRFAAPARHVADQLDRLGIDLVYDNIAVAEGNLIPRMRSFPRNALTYAGVCAAVLPLAFFFAWDRRRRVFGWMAVAACLFGAAFSLARGAWVAIALGALYLLIDGVVTRDRKLQIAGAVVAAALFLTGFFLVKYGADPMTARAGAEGSIGTRQALYRDTVQALSGAHVLVGFGTEQPRTDEGRVRLGYVPPAGTHSTYLNYLFRAGVPGALMIIALYGVAGLHARSEARETDGPRRTLATLAAASVVITAAHAVILSLYVEPVYMLTVTLVLGIATGAVTTLRSSVIPWRRKRAAA